MPNKFKINFRGDGPRLTFDGQWFLFTPFRVVKRIIVGIALREADSAASVSP